MTVQCLYQNDPKDAAAVLGQRNACRRAANKLGWLIQQERHLRRVGGNAAAASP